MSTHTHIVTLGSNILRMLQHRLEATEPGTGHQSILGQVPQRTQCPAAGHRHHCSPRWPRWCWTLCPVVRSAVFAAPGNWTLTATPVTLAKSTLHSPSLSVSPRPESESSMCVVACLVEPRAAPRSVNVGGCGFPFFMEGHGLCLPPRLYV